MRCCALQVGKFFGALNGNGFVHEWLLDKKVYQKCARASKHHLLLMLLPPTHMEPLASYRVLSRRFQVIDHQATCTERKEKSTEGAGERLGLALLAPARALAAALAHLVHHCALCARVARRSSFV